MVKRKICTLNIILLVCFVSVFLFSGMGIGSDITFSVANKNLQPGCSGELTLNLENLNHQIYDVPQMDLVAENEYLTCTGCTATERIPGGNCSAVDMGGGRCRVVFFNIPPSCMESGEGPIGTIFFNVGADAPANSCTDLDIENIAGIGACGGSPHPTVTGESSLTCFTNDGDLYPPGTGECSVSGTSCNYTYSEDPAYDDCPPGEVCVVDSCGDCVIDLYDIGPSSTEPKYQTGIFAFILGTKVPNTCQVPRADMANGMPPYCGDPSGTPNCLTDGVIHSFDALVMIDKALDKENCIDYVCEDDPDADGFLINEDNCPRNFNPDQTDTDEDGLGDVCDNCPQTPNGPDGGTCTAGQVIGVPCFKDSDCGGCTPLCSMNQEDIDGDGIGDACDN